MFNRTSYCATYSGRRLRSLLRSLSPDTIWQLELGIWNHPDWGLNLTLAMSCGPLDKWPRLSGALVLHLPNGDYNSYFSRFHEMKYTKETVNDYLLLYLLPFVSLPEEPNHPQCGSFPESRKECLREWKQRPVERASRQDSRTEDNVWAQRMTSPRDGDVYRACYCTIRPDCKGASVLEKLGIT